MGKGFRYMEKDFLGWAGFRFLAKTFPAFFKKIFYIYSLINLSVLLTVILFLFYSLKNKFMANTKPSRRNFIKQLFFVSALPLPAGMQ
jgi:hypothetical protein